jgi:hypothetical protein
MPKPVLAAMPAGMREVTGDAPPIDFAAIAAVVARQVKARKAG